MGAPFNPDAAVIMGLVKGPVMVFTLKSKLKELVCFFEALSPSWLIGLGLLGCVVVILAGVGWWLSRGDWVYPDQLHAEDVVEQDLAGSTTIGQTIVVYQAGLQGIEIKGRSVAQSNGRPMTIHIRPGLEAEDLRQATISSSELMEDGWARFSFEPLPDSRLGYYYFFVEAPDATTADEIKLRYGPPEAYLDGALYLNGHPQEGQLAFRLIYNRPAMLADFVRSAFIFVPGTIAIILVFVIPGWAMLSLFLDTGTYYWVEKLGVAVGLSMALYPLLLLWSHLVGLQLGALNAWLPIVLGGGVILWRYQPWRLGRKQILPTLRSWRSAEALWPAITFMVIISLIGAARYFMVQDLTMPLWADSVQHAVIIKRILEAGGLFQSWEPYTPYQTFSNQFGFHANVAVWQWVTGLGFPQAMLSGGQVLNLLAVVTLYPLAYRIQGAWAGVITVLIAGMLTQFPNYYTNWGRYPQLLGQAILPVAAWWVVIILNKDEARGRYIAYILGGGMLAAGAVLSYFRMSFHYVTFIVALLGVLFIAADWTVKKVNWWALFGTLTVMGLLILPWIQPLLGGRFGVVAPGASEAGGVVGLWRQVQIMTIGWPASQAVMIFVGTLMAIWLRGLAALPIVWLWALVTLPLLRLTRLPGTGIIQEFTITTSLYIPMALIGGIAIGYLLQRMSAKSQWASAWIALGVIAIGVGKLPSLSATADRAFDLSSIPDVQAANWIKEKLPQESLFLINGIVYTDGVSAVAGDAGWWLPILSGRRVVIPPQYALLIERPDPPDYSASVNELVRKLFDVSATTPAGKAAICNFPIPITHVYLGQHRGLVDQALPNPPPHAMLSAKQLLQDSDFHLIYHRDRVMIFEFDRMVCN
jgi:hypothetical protein